MEGEEVLEDEEAAEHDLERDGPVESCETGSIRCEVADGLEEGREVDVEDQAYYGEGEQALA